MKGGEGIDDIQISLDNCGRKKRFNLKNPFKKCIVLSYNNRKITIIYKEKIKNIIVKYFDDNTSNIYYKKEKYKELPNLIKFSIIINELMGFFLPDKYYFDKLKYLDLIVRIRIFINEIQNDDLKFRMIDNWLKKILEELRPDFLPSSPPDKKKAKNQKQVTQSIESNKKRVKQRLYQDNLNKRRAEKQASQEKKLRPNYVEILQRLNEWEPTASERQPVFTHRTNYSKQPNYQSYIQKQNETKPNNSR